MSGAQAYAKMDRMVFVAIPFFILGASFSMMWRDGGVSALKGLGIMSLVVGALAAAWIYWCRRRGADGWITWAPAWAFCGGFLLGLIPGLDVALS